MMYKSKLKMGKGQELYAQAKKIIPGGTMLLSKRPEMFLPEFWPAYYSKAKGCKVWDLEGKELIDMSIMGIGTNTLGYGNDEVDNAVMQVVKSGNMSTLNCPEEVYLAEKLLEINPWARMVRFARTGGEINSIAIRIARAATGKEKIAICGYHGWHDWYLSANLNSQDGLNEHLIPGLNPLGVSSKLKDTIFPFHYNKLEELNEIVLNHDIGVIIMEVQRNIAPQNGFLNKVRELASQKGIVLIFDECTSGFRETYGGLHRKYEVEPDMAVFAKALGNGYAISALVGRREVMEFAQSTFISSTFWTERIGSTAAIATLNVMQQKQSWELITNIGKQIQKIWQDLADVHSLSITIQGLPSLSSFQFNHEHSLAYKTLIAQEMLKRGYLASTIFYACTEHSEDIVNDYSVALDEVFRLISKCENGDIDVFSILNGPICHKGFNRLN